MSCPTFDSVSREVDGELSELEAQAVRTHVNGCDSCRARRAELLSLNAALRKSALPVATESLKARLAAAALYHRRAKGFASRRPSWLLRSPSLSSSRW